MPPQELAQGRMVHCAACHGQTPVHNMATSYVCPYCGFDNVLLTDEELRDSAIDDSGDTSVFQSVMALDRDLSRAASLMHRVEARFLADSYHFVQKRRMAIGLRMSKLETEPTELMQWLHKNTRISENNIKRALQKFAYRWDVGLWMNSIHGIGPVISSGLLSHIDIRRQSYAGQLWSHAGFGNKPWLPGKKRPWNARLKTLCYHAGESFIKHRNSEKSFYGQYYDKYREIHDPMNEAGAYRELALELAASGRWKKTTEQYRWYSQGLLSPAHMHARARRVVIKLFLSHVFEVMFREFHQQEPPPPYIFSEVFQRKNPGERHGHYIGPPNLPIPDTGETLREMFAEADQVIARVRPDDDDELPEELEDLEEDERS